MDNQQSRTGELVDTTDCLEAVSVFRCWKNFLFAVVLLCMVVLQACFWTVNLGIVKSGSKSAEPHVESLAAVTETQVSEEVAATAGAAQEQTRQDANQASQAVEAAEKIKQTAKEVLAEVEQAAEPTVTVTVEKPEQAEQPAEQETDSRPTLAPKAKHISALIRFVNFILIPAAVLYCLTMLFTLKISLLGRLGGINHIARAFFLSLVFVVLLLPWQLLFAPVFVGVMFTPDELLAAYSIEKGLFATLFFYLRVSGYWLLAFALLIFAQIRSIRWAKATLRRLEVI